MTKSALEGRTAGKSAKASTGMKRQLSSISKTQTVTIPKPVFKLNGNSSGKATAGSKAGQQGSASSQGKIPQDMKMEIDDEPIGGSSKRKREEDDFEVV